MAVLEVRSLSARVFTAIGRKLRPQWPTGAAAAVVLLAGIVAYHNSLRGPLVMDDTASIEANTSVRHLWPPAKLLGILVPPGDLTVSGRPVLNLTVAINYALARYFTGDPFHVGGYHALNLGLHLLAALVLLGVVRRTLQTPRLRDRFGAAATPLALAVAGIWVVHPLATAAVTYVIQRCEVLVGLFFLLTLYCVIRGAQALRPRHWYVPAVGFCLLGMASKESMAAAPILIFLYDRTFLADSVRQLWRLRWRLHLALAATWILLGVLVLTDGSRTGTVGWGAADLLHFDLTQIQALVHFLGLCFWPHPLIFDYGTRLVHSLRVVWPEAIVLLALLMAAAWAVWRRFPAGFPAAVFFLVLAPGSSLIPLATQPVGEHRMYLPLAAVVALTVVGGYALWRYLGRIVGWPWLRHWSLPALGIVAAGITLAVVTMRRNDDYRSVLVLWQDTVSKCPLNSRAHINLGDALLNAGQFVQAKAQIQQAIRLDPRNGLACRSLARLLAIQGHIPQAIAELHRAIGLEPGLNYSYLDLARLLALQGRWRQALAVDALLLREHPDSAQAYDSIGEILFSVGRIPDALAAYRRALAIEPDAIEIRNDLGKALASLGEWHQAADQYRQAIELQPAYAEAHANLAEALLALGQPDQAVAQYQHAVQLRPDLAVLHSGLAKSLVSAGHTSQGIAEYHEALKLAPNDVRTHNALGEVLVAQGRWPQAVEQFRAVVHLRPQVPEAHNNLAIALSHSGQIPQAIEEYRAAVRLRPDSILLRNNLAAALAQAGRVPQALDEYERSLQQNSTDLSTQKDLAFLLATRSPAQGGNPARAVALAERLCRQTGYRHAPSLAVLAAADAAAGRFPEAVAMAERARTLARSQGQQSLVRQMDECLALYRAQRPYRVSATPASPPPRPAGSAASQP